MNYKKLYPYYFYLSVDTGDTKTVIEELKKLGLKVDPTQEKDWMNKDYFHTDRKLFCFSNQLWERNKEIDRLADTFTTYQHPVMVNYSLTELLTKFHQQEQENRNAFTDASPGMRPSLEMLPIRARTEPVCLAAINNNPLNIKYVPREFMSDRVINATLDQEGTYIRYIDKYLLNQEKQERALRSNGEALEFVPKTEKNCKLAIENTGYAIRFVPEQFKSKELCKNAIRTSMQADFSNYVLLQHIPHADIVLDAIKTFTKDNKIPVERIASLIRPEIINQEIADTLLDLDGRTFRNLPEQLQNKANATKAVQMSGLHACPEKFWNNETIEMHIAMRHPLSVLQFGKKDGENLLTPEVCLLVHKLRPDCIKGVEDDHNDPRMYYNGWIRIPDEVLNTKNVYTFNKSLEKETGFKLSYKEVVNIYKGSSVGFAVKATGTSPAKTVHLSYNPYNDKLNVITNDIKMSRKNTNKKSSPKI